MWDEKTQKFKSCCQSQMYCFGGYVLANPEVFALKTVSRQSTRLGLNGGSYLENKFHWFAVMRSVWLLNCWPLHCWWTVTMHVFSIDIPFDHLISLFSFLKQFLFRFGVQQCVYGCVSANALDRLFTLFSLSLSLLCFRCVISLQVLLLEYAPLACCLLLHVCTQFGGGTSLGHCTNNVHQTLELHQSDYRVFVVVHYFFTTCAWLVSCHNRIEIYIRTFAFLLLLRVFGFFLLPLLLLLLLVCSIIF